MKVLITIEKTDVCIVNNKQLSRRTTIFEILSNNRRLLPLLKISMLPTKENCFYKVAPIRPVVRRPGRQAVNLKVPGLIFGGVRGLSVKINLSQ